MAPRERELTRHQISSGLSYRQEMPAFLRRLQNQVGGRRDEDDYDEDAPAFGDDAEFEEGSGGRPPIPRRPAIPERPSDDPGSADEDDGDEKPQVVVLKEGKHLTEREAENIRRKERGLPPLPDPNTVDVAEPPEEVTKPKKKEDGPSLSFSSSSSKTAFGSKKSSAKRKLTVQKDDLQKAADALKDKNAPKKKKQKKERKTLLSFGDDT